MWKFNVQIQANCNQNILNELFCSSKLMLEYLIEFGKPIPDWIGQKLYEIEKALVEKQNTQKITTNENVTGEIEKDSNSLITYAGEITKMYRELATLSQPTSPKTLKDTNPTGKIFYLFGNKCIPFMRNLWVMSLFFLAGFITTGYLSTVDSTNGLWFQLFLVFSAGLGAYFYSLYTIRKYIINRTFDDRYTSHYYSRIIMGILAGYILANFIDASLLTKENEGLIMKLTPSLFSLLGGFSSDAVVKILNRIVAMLTALVEGDVKDIIESKEQQIKNKYELSKLKHNSEIVLELSSIAEHKVLKQDTALQDQVKSLIKNLLNKVD